MSGESLRIPVRGESCVTRAVLETASLCRKLGLRDDQNARVTTSVSELARNIIKYAGSGEILVRERSSSSTSGVEIVATDRGPGIEDTERALEDHYSSGGTLGLGLPGVKRLMDEFQIESEPGEGTRVTALLWR